MRLLMFHRNNSDARFRCFGCCHVQTGAVCLGIYHLVLEIMSIIILTYIILDPEMGAINRKDNFYYNNSGKVATVFQRKSSSQALSLASPFRNSSSETMEAINGGAEPLPTPLPQSRDPPIVDEGNVDKPGHFLPNGVGSQFTLIMLLGLMIITLMMIYGAIKAKHLYILPYFGYQVFDFAVTSLMAVSYYSWIPNANEFINNNPDFPFAQTLSKYNLQWIGLLVLLVYVAVLLVKAYFIGVIFACYQYCQLRSKGILTYQEEANGARTVSELLLPPAYEAAVKMQPTSAQESPPPPYRSV